MVSMSEQKKDDLATMGMTQSEFGAALVTEAQNRKQKERLEKSIATAQTILASLEECNERINYFSEWKKTREAQLDALQLGKFSFDTHGEIVYEDKDLNRR
jgi:hypothetical protein